MNVKKTIGGPATIVLGYLMLEPGNCLEYQIFNFLDGKNWRKEMREIRKQFLLDEEYNNPEKTVRFVGGSDGQEH